MSAGNLVFGVFFALVAVCAIRGLSLHAGAWWRRIQDLRVGTGPTRERVAMRLPAGLSATEMSSD